MRFDELPEVVDMMRQKGIMRLRLGDTEIVLGCEPRDDRTSGTIPIAGATLPPGFAEALADDDEILAPEDEAEVQEFRRWQRGGAA